MDKVEPIAATVTIAMAIIVCQSAQKQRKTLKNPPLTLEQYLDTLMRQGLPQSATALGSLLAN